MEPVREWRVSGSVSEANAKAAAPSERKLTSIVVADVVGYSRLTAADEDGTLALLRELRSELVDPAVGRHRGRIVKQWETGFLLNFQASSMQYGHRWRSSTAWAIVRSRMGLRQSACAWESTSAMS